ncbi:hypothetical protein VTN00DRAFT_9122 [Thermoascus crustaceus]|uniref:uncharacterized protein n=1 Tax=Thermoascus crustaceus TaxID=5088 RepID=UPI0037447C3D
MLHGTSTLYSTPVLLCGASPGLGSSAGTASDIVQHHYYLLYHHARILYLVGLTIYAYQYLLIHFTKQKNQVYPERSYRIR